jgi:hypothetical protein
LGEGAPTTLSDRDKVAKAMFWRRDRMLENKDAGCILGSRIAIYAKFASTLTKEAHMLRMVTMRERPELADRYTCNNIEL